MPSSALPILRLQQPLIVDSNLDFELDSMVKLEKEDDLFRISESDSQDKDEDKDLDKYKYLEVEKDEPGGHSYRNEDDSYDDDSEYGKESNSEDSWVFPQKKIQVLIYSSDEED
jgi:hypothetical protein